MGRSIHRNRRGKPGPGEAEAIRAVVLAHMHRRGRPLEFIAEVLGSSSSTMHRRLRELTPDRLAELESADLEELL